MAFQAWNTNLLPLFTDPGWVKMGLAATTFVAAADGKSCSYQAASASDYIYYQPDAAKVLGKNLAVCAGTFNTSDNAAWLNVRSYNAAGSYTSPVHRPGNYTVGTEVTFTILATQAYVRVFFMHTTTYTGVATVNVGNVYLYDVDEVQTGTQAAPTGLTSTPPTTYGALDGSITGTTTAMEYRLSTTATYSACTGTTVSGLGAGTYYVRMAATESLSASPDTTVFVATGALQTPAAPTGLSSTACTRQGATDGTITGVTAAMEYRVSTTASYTTVSGTTITGLVAGTYYVRFSAVEGYTVSADTTVVVADGAPVDYTKYTNILPKMNTWTAEGVLTNVGFTNTYSIVYDTPDYGAYYYCKILAVADLIGHPLEIGAASFSVSNASTSTFFRLTVESTAGVVTDVFALKNNTFQGGHHYTFTPPADTKAIRIYVRQTGNAATTISMSDAFLYNMDEDLTPEEPEEPIPGYPFKFNKVLAANLPSSIVSGTEQIIFTSTGLTARMYISDNVGVIHPVKFNPRAFVDHSYAAYNPQAVYTQAYIAAKKATITALQQAGDTFTFTIVTDIHLGKDDQTSSVSRVRHLEDVVMLTKQIPIDYIAMTGDILAATEPREDTKWRLRTIMDVLKKADCPTYVIRGNHDFNTDWYGGSAPISFENLVSNQMWYEYVQRGMSQERVHYASGYEDLGYFYVDMPNIKHRAIFVSSYEYWDTPDGGPVGSTVGYVPGSSELAGVCQTAQQFNWLMNEAFHMEKHPGWSVSFYSHQLPYTDKGTASYEFHHYGGDAPEFRAILKLLQDGTAKTGAFPCMDRQNGSWTTVPYDAGYFATQGPIPVVGFFAGHIHDDCYKKINNLNCVVATSTCQSQRLSWTGCDDHPTKLPPPRNKTDLSMSQNVYIVNRTTRTVHMVKVGSARPTGSDFSFTY